MPPPAAMGPLFDHLCKVCWLVISRSNNPQQMRERFERSREASRNICDTLGMKPLTNQLIKWWEIVTTVMSTENKAEFTYVPWQSLNPATLSRTSPLSSLQHLPFIDVLTADLDDGITLIASIEDRLGTEGLNVEAKTWLQDLRETMTDIFSVCNIWVRLHPKLNSDWSFWARLTLVFVLSMQSAGLSFDNGSAIKKSDATTNHAINKNIMFP